VEIIENERMIDYYNCFNKYVIWKDADYYNCP